jgi:hypothetical protein
MGRNSSASRFSVSRGEVPCSQELGSLEPSLVALAVALPSQDGVTVKNTASLARERWDPWSVAGAGPQGLSPRQLLEGAGPQGLSPRQLLVGARPQGLSPRQLLEGAGPWGLSPRQLLVGARPQGLSPRQLLEGEGPWGLSPRWPVAGAGPWGLSPRQLRWAALSGELFAALLLFASGNVPPILLRSLQLFLRF